MKTAALTLGVLAMTATCGGTIRYVHPTKSDADFAVDDADCQQEAARRFPPVYSTSQVGDQNETSRLGWTSRCLYERGWRQQKEPGSP